MNVNVAVNTKGMEAACAALAKMSGKAMEEVVESELGKIIDQTIIYTKSASQASIKRTQANRQFTSQPAGLYAPKLIKGVRRGWQSRPVKFTKGGYVKYNLKFRYPAQLWSAIKAARQKSLQRRFKAIGLSKKSWWDIGKALGLPVKGGRFTSAIAQTGEAYPGDFTSSRKSSPGGVEISFTNSQPTVNIPQVGGARALQAAIDGRVKYFLKNVQHGVLQSMQQIARAYPGLKLNP